MSVQKEITRENNERNILKAAEEIFAQYGFRGATTDLIAKQAGLPKANIHYYYKTKELLYRAVLERVLDEWSEAAKVFEQYEEPKVALTKYIESKMKFSRSRPYASKVWANEVLHGADAVSGFLKTSVKTWLNDRNQLLQKWIYDKKIKPVDPTAFFYMIWAATQHYADFDHQIVILNDGLPYSDEEYQQKIKQLTELILGSVGLD